MGATNTTANYSLSQFIGTDKPAWLQDYNGDMLKIDTGINAAKVAADGAQNSASAAQNDANTANNAITNTINPAITSLNTTVGSQGGAINTINALIGNGTPTTTDQTIIGAINEINAKQKVLTKVAAGVAGDTYAQQLTALQTVFASLTTEEKVDSFIIDGNSVARFGSLTGTYSLCYSDGSTGIVSYFINTAKRYFNTTDQSSNTDSNSIELWTYKKS